MIRLEHLFLLVEIYSGSTKLAEATISTRIFNDGDRIRLLRAGGDLGVRKLARAIQWFADHWPEDAQWPVDFERPSQTVVAEVAQ